MKAKTVLVCVGGMTVGVTGTIYMSRNALREAFIKWSVDKVNEKVLDAMSEYKPNKYGYSSYRPYAPPSASVSAAVIRKTSSKPWGSKADTREVIDFVTSTRKEVEEILDHLRETIDHYGNVSIGEYYEQVGYSPTMKDLQFGWTDLNAAYTQPSNSGFRIKFPQPIKLNDDKEEVEDEKSN